MGCLAEEIVHLPEVKDPSYSRPTQEAYTEACSGPNIAGLACTLQVHACHDLQCLIKLQNR